jgi:hypothetical protein
MAYFRTTRIIYAVVVVLALVFGHATLTGWAIVLVVGALLALFEVYARRMAVTHVSATVARALLADDADAAEKELERARGAKVPLGAAPLVVASMEAEIALLRGKIDDVRAIVDAALRRPRDRLDRVTDGTCRRELAAVGAIARATAGDADGALAAADEVETDESASLRALARVTIARAIVLARTNRRAELGALLRERQTILDLGTSARERNLTRAFGRLARTPASSIYRRSSREVDGARRGWVHVAAGDAADHLAPSPGDVEESGRGARAEPLRAKTATARAVPAAPPTRRRAHVLALWAILVASFLAVFQALPRRTSAPAGVEQEAWPLGGSLDHLCATFILAAGVTVLFRIRAATRGWNEISALTATYARGDERGARARLTEIAGQTNRALAAHASLSLATLAIHRGEAQASRAAASGGLARLSTKELKLATSDLLYPELVAHWAFGLAAEGDVAGARGAIASMPDYCRAVRSRFRVELLARWREGDEAGAAAWAAGGERDAAVSASDEVLADAIRAVVAGDAMTGSERARIVDEVGDPRWRRYLDGVAPDLGRRVEALAADDAASSDAGASAAEREAAAEEEIARMGFAAAVGRASAV